MKIRVFITIYLCLVGSSNLRANELYYRNIYKNDPQKLVSSYDSYALKASSQEDEIYLLYYTARVCQDSRLTDSANKYLRELEDKLKKYKGKFGFKSKFYSNIAMLYNNGGFVNKSKKMLQTSKILSDHIIDKYGRGISLSYFYFRSAHISSINKDYLNALKLYLKADEEFTKITYKGIDYDYSFIGTAIAINIGDAYMDRKDYNKAIYYNKLAILRDIHKNESGVAFLNLAYIYSTLGSQDLALQFYLKSVDPLKKEGINDYANNAYDSIKSIYKLQGNGKMFRYYERLQNQNLNKLERYDDKSIELQKIPRIDQSYSRQTIYIGLLFLIALSGLIIVALFIRLKLRNRVRIQEKNNLAEPSAINIVEELQNVEIDRSSRVSVAYEENLLQKLRQFEYDLLYLEPSMSLAKLSALLDTNPKTISEIINKNTEKNFNQYINTLRINYICEKLKSDLKYRKYKIAYLATECGFVSHSTFTKVFKANTGVSPSEYIENL